MKKNKTEFEKVVYFQEGPGVRNWQFRASGIKLINIRNLVEDGLFLDNTSNFLDEEEVNTKYKHFLLNAGDFVMASSGVTWGKIAEVKECNLPLCLNTSVIRLLSRNDDVLDKWYLYYFIKSPEFRRQIERLITGSAQPNFGPSHLKKVYINLPGIDIQKEAVSYFVKLEKIIKDRQIELNYLDELIKARFVELFGDPSHNEKEWDIKDLVDVTTIVTYGLTVRPEYIDDGIDLVSARELHKGYVAYEEAPKISSEDFESLSDKGKPQKNDILFSKTGSIGHCALVEDEKPFAITQNAARIGLDIEKVNPVWLLHYLRMDYIQDWCKKHAKGNAVKDFQLQDMKIIPLFDCPLELQDSFTEFVRLVDKSKVAVQKSLDETRLLFDSLMQEYFG